METSISNDGSNKAVQLLEKSGNVVLTKDDLILFSQGEVSPRLQETWGLTLEELKSIIHGNSYTSQ